MNTKFFHKQLLLTITFLSILQFTVFAYKDPIKFGKVDKADLEMKAYPTDTSAAAAILCDYGFFNSAQFQTVRILRIKIFKKEGTSWGNQVFSLSSKADIHGITYNLENGEIVESKLKSESIFEERVTEDYFRTRVAMPNVKEGSIIDLEFVYNGLPSVWRFQDEVPVRWSELIIEPSEYVKFRKTFYGYEPLSEITEMRSVAKEMPAFKPEPYMNSTGNFISKYEIEPISIHFPPTRYNSMGVYREFSTTWDAVNILLREGKYFGLVLQGCSFLNGIAKEIESNYPDSVQRLKAAHAAIKKAVKWNDIESLTTTAETLGTPFNKKIGNSADINLLLIQLLKKLDFKVYPVGLSTRKNGFLSPINPSLRRLNYVVAYVILGGKTYFLDATEEFLPIGMLPERCINLQGRLIDDKKSDWVDLMPDKKEKKFTQFDLNLEADNVLTGKLTTSNYDYAALNFRIKYGKFNSKEEYVKDFESTNKGLSVLNCEITNLDSIYLPLKESYEIKIKNKVTTSGDLIYINPLLFEQLTSNPFKTEDRKYPVDFIYPSEKVYMFRLNLPEGAQVTELPKPLTMRLEDGSASVQYQVATTGNVVQLYYKFVLNKAIYTEVEYGDLRALFSELVKKQSEQIVIKIL